MHDKKYSIPGIKTIFLTWIIFLSTSRNIFAKTETPKGLKPKIAMTSLAGFFVLTDCDSQQIFSKVGSTSR